jgi:RNase adaptor protein for sRNA GlmZ degradation
VQLSALALPNPHNDARLRNFNGLSPEVQTWLGNATFAALVTLVMTKACQRSNAIVAVCCHGGVHRSVAVVANAASRLRACGHDLTELHLERDKWPTKGC